MTMLWPTWSTYYLMVLQSVEEVREEQNSARRQLINADMSTGQMLVFGWRNYTGQLSNMEGTFKPVQKHACKQATSFNLILIRTFPNTKYL